MTLKELAQRLGITPDSLRMQIRRGALAGTRVGTGAHAVWIVEDDEAKRYEEEQAGKRGTSSPRHPGTGGRPPKEQKNA